MRRERHEERATYRSFGTVEDGGGRRFVGGESVFWKKWEKMRFLGRGRKWEKLIRDLVFKDIYRRLNRRQMVSYHNQAFSDDRVVAKWLVIITRPLVTINRR